MSDERWEYDGERWSRAWFGANKDLPSWMVLGREPGSLTYVPEEIGWACGCRRKGASGFHFSDCKPPRPAPLGAGKCAVCHKDMTIHTRCEYYPHVCWQHDSWGHRIDADGNLLPEPPPPPQPFTAEEREQIRIAGIHRRGALRMTRGRAG